MEKCFFQDKSVKNFNDVIHHINIYLRFNRMYSKVNYTEDYEINLLTNWRNEAVKYFTGLIDYLNENIDIYNQYEIEWIINESEKVYEFTINKCDDYMRVRYSLKYDTNRQAYFPV